LNLGAEIFFKNPEHKRVYRNIIANYGKWIIDAFDAFDEKIEDMSLASQRVLDKVVNTTMNPMFIEHLLGEFVCNTLDMLSPEC